MYSWDFSALQPYWGLIWNGLGTTVIYTLVTVAAGAAIGLVVGILRLNAARWLDILLRAYIEVFRCTPLLVQLVWVYYALPVLIGVDMSAATACFITLSLYAGSFYAEIFRGGILAVDKGQWEAGRAIGMRRGKIFRRIILPQAVQVMIPSLINQTVLQLKNTSLVSVVAVSDLLYQGSVITAASYRPLEVYTVIAVLYFAVLFPLTLVADRIEARMGAHK
ncbi:polar amino acid transport system permease protein [Pseudochelatococcus lubricantis]|uniref:Polar amino acid transport system permease protein n=1 Tax=Pseudochelatococcus lubricantis TaxID=1538102 RepID=A0ABX0V1A5_9HYPH|nr:amino acid ABC transporter permease [Pseudochelatococcus lubricantis]NIJ58349.1 polar amino acid transport system permease protein [Pseudochelatococcus lubricantis]